MEYRIKGNRVSIDRNELRSYLDAKVRELAAMATNLVMSLVIVSVVVVFNYMMVPTFVYFSVILIPVFGRGWLLAWLDNWLRRLFADLYRAA